MNKKQAVTHELTRGKEFAMQLKIHLHDPSSSTEFQKFLIHNILDSYNKSLSLLTTGGLNPNGSNNESYSQAERSITRTESQVSLSESPCDAHVDHEFKDPNHKDSSAKRRSKIEKWKNRVQIRGDMRVEEALDDGYDWKKYGQRNILDAKHPRGYYRCTYRQLQGCLATKQVQKLDEDPSIFDITYHGSHTCNPDSRIASTPQNQSLRSLEDLPTDQHNPPFHFPSFDNTIGHRVTSRSTFSQVSQLPVDKSPRAMNLDSALSEDISAKTLSTRSHNVDVGFLFAEMEFANNSSFDNSGLYD